MYSTYTNQAETELKKITGLKQILILSHASELNRLTAEPSVAIISEGMRGEQRGNLYNRYVGVSVYLKTVIINDSAVDKDGDSDLFTAVCEAVESLKPSVYTATPYASDDRTMTRKISFEKLTR